MLEQRRNDDDDNGEQWGHFVRVQTNRTYWIRACWIGLDWTGLDWVGLGCIGLRRIALDWDGDGRGLDRVNKRYHHISLLYLLLPLPFYSHYCMAILYHHDHIRRNNDGREEVKASFLSFFFLEWGCIYAVVSVVLCLGVYVCLLVCLYVYAFMFISWLGVIYYQTTYIRLS